MFCNNLSGKIIWKRINRCITESLCCTPESNTSLLINSAAKSLQSCPTLCDPRDGSPPGFPVPGLLQARTLEWVAISFSNAWKWKVKVKVKSCPTLNDPMDCSLLGSSVHGIFQARVLEWSAIAFSDTHNPETLNNEPEATNRFFSSHTSDWCVEKNLCLTKSRRLTMRCLLN